MRCANGAGSEREDDDDVTASEVAAYTYCAKAWHIERVLRLSADEQASARRTQGTEDHVAHGMRLKQLQRFGRRAVWLGGVLLAGAGVLIVIALLL